MWHGNLRMSSDNVWGPSEDSNGVEKFTKQRTTQIHNYKGLPARMTLVRGNPSLVFPGPGKSSRDAAPERMAQATLGYKMFVMTLAASSAADKFPS